MHVKVKDERERLIAEQALLAYREVEAARQSAPWGQGLAKLEDATLQAGRRQMRGMLEQALSSQAKAQKKGADARTADGPSRSSEPCPKR